MTVVHLNRTTRWKLKLKKMLRDIFPEKKQAPAPKVSDSYYDPKQFRRQR